MPTIGKVKIGQNIRTTVVSPNFKPKSNVALAEITDVSTTNVQDGFALVYSSANNKYEVKAVQGTVTNVNGGAF